MKEHEGFFNKLLEIGEGEYGRRKNVGRVQPASSGGTALLLLRGWVSKPR